MPLKCSTTFIFSFKDPEMQFEKFLLGFILQAIFAFVRTQNEVR